VEEEDTRRYSRKKARATPALGGVVIKRCHCEPKEKKRSLMAFFGKGRVSRQQQKEKADSLECWQDLRMPEERNARNTEKGEGRTPRPFPREGGFQAAGDGGKVK